MCDYNEWYLKLPQTEIDVNSNWFYKWFLEIAFVFQNRDIPTGQYMCIIKEFTYSVENTMNWVLFTF